MPGSGHIDYAALNSVQRYTQWVVLRIIPGKLGSERGETIAQTQMFFDRLEQENKVVVRGIYDVSSFRADADYMIWWHAEEVQNLQQVYNDFRRDTALGQASEVVWTATGVHRPSEFNKNHLPSFIMDESPGDWITVYPFVRSYDWYLLEDDARREILADHGRAARDFADVRANTVAAFGLGDYEWLLAFEASDLGRNVDLMHRMRYTEARLHVREEIPFFSGRRVAEVAELINVLP